MKYTATEWKERTTILYSIPCHKLKGITVNHFYHDSHYAISIITSKLWVFVMKHYALSVKKRRKL